MMHISICIIFIPQAQLQGRKGPNKIMHGNTYIWSHYLSSITQDTLWSCFELQSVLFKRDFQMGIKTTMHFKGKLQGSKRSPKSGQNYAKTVQQCVGHFIRKLTRFGPSFWASFEGHNFLHASPYLSSKNQLSNKVSHALFGVHLVGPIKPTSTRYFSPG